MASDNKTQETDQSVQAFLDTVEDEGKRKDAYALLQLMQGVTGFDARMWGPSIVGFGSYHYKYESGREGDSSLVAFSPRKQNLTVYISSGIDDLDELLGRLGKHKTGKGCLYINRLADVDQEVLKELVKRTVEFRHKTHSESE
ncbi:MAG: DUF1801 domain-containing protein [Anaerolineae bacterium]